MADVTTSLGRERFERSLLMLLRWSGEHEIAAQVEALWRSQDIRDRFGRHVTWRMVHPMLQSDRSAA